MKIKEAEFLIQKYLSDSCTEKEQEVLESWYLQQNLGTAGDITDAERKTDLKKVFAKLEAEYTKPQQILIWPRIAVAASVLFAVSIGFYFYLTKNSETRQQNKQHYTEQIQPGSNKAVLILANGKRICLDDAEVGELAAQSGMKITKTADGQIIYTVSSSATNEAYGSNTIETPRGGQYQVNLPDGTKIWLNAASTLSYPTRFVDDKREVQLSGEAYFEVAKDEARPFRVISNTQVVEVLGTHFNINSYSDEIATKTTLLEGSVRVTQSSTNKNLLLQPGNQSVISKQGILMSVANLEEAISWKNGHFMFVNESLGSIMRKLARWYNVDVNYNGEIANRTYSGAVSKYEDVAEVLHTLELTKSVRFKVEGNTITALSRN